MRAAARAPRHTPRLQLSRERLFATLRQHAVLQLGEVKLAYFEASGQLSLYRCERPNPGLCLLPNAQASRYTKLADPRRSVCKSCGFCAERPPETCTRCGHADWQAAVRTAAIDEL